MNYETLFISNSRFVYVFNKSHELSGWEQLHRPNFRGNSGCVVVSNMTNHRMEDCKDKSSIAGFSQLFDNKEFRKVFLIKTGPKTLCHN